MSHSPTPERWQQVERLLDAALDLPVDQRAALLGSACAGDAELRAEVERLLLACEQSEHFLEEPAEAFADPIISGLARHLQPTVPGARIGPYRILEEAGRGGMAVVYLAERDDGHFRKRVALKLVGAGLVLEDELLRRFREERQILAALEHPGIARLIDGGVTEEGLPWFAMEYVEGTPIEHYCDERRLPIESRLALFCKVCDAVQHAHHRGIVHRDLKPGNILITAPDAEEPGEGQVKLLDFGIAKLLAPGSAAEAAERTRPRMRLMTPEYASPEQVRGEAVTPAADAYALGVLLYRLLCGHHPHPHTGRTKQAMEQRLLDTQPQPPSGAISRARGAGVDGRDRATPEAVAAVRGVSAKQLRRRLRGELDAIVLKALFKEPERRYANAGEFAAEVRRHLQGQEARRRGARVVLTVGASIGVLTLAVAGWFARGQDAAPAIDPAVIVVAPFHVAADGSFDYLREGLLDLLATRLNGEAGSRAVDPRAVIAAWRRVTGQDDGLSAARAQGIARGLGAGQLLMGSVVGTSERLILNVTLYDAVRSTVRTRVSSAGPADSLPALVDALVRQILVREAGVPPHQLAALTTTSLPALRSYLAGRQNYRSGHRGEAVRQLEEALSHDSTFALAAIHLRLAAGSGPLTAAPDASDRALRLAWAERDRLGRPDRLFLEALAGPRYPDASPRHERLAAFTRAVDASPDRPEILALMGAFLGGGVVRGEASAHERSAEYFRRALALDSSYAVPAYHLVREAAAVGDVATVRRIARRYLATDSTSEMAQLVVWMEAASSGDARAILDVRGRMPTMHPTALGWIVFHALLLGRDMDGAEAALAALRAMVRSELEWGNHRFREWEYLGNTGRLVELQMQLEESARATMALGAIDELGISAARRATVQRSEYLIRSALFWGTDTTGIGEATSVMEDTYRRGPAAEGDPFARFVVAESACFAALSRVSTGELTGARAAVDRLRELLDGRLQYPQRASHASCAATVDALIAVAAGSRDARMLVERADSVLIAEPQRRMTTSRMQLLLARAFDALDDPEAGLRVIRRRGPANPAYFLATILAEEGRLAARTGDGAGAVRAYRHYLALRTHPDPALVPEVQQIRAQLSDLLASR